MIGLVENNGCHVGGHQSHIEISAHDLSKQFIGCGHHGEFIGTFCLTL